MNFFATGIMTRNLLRLRNGMSKFRKLLNLKENRTDMFISLCSVNLKTSLSTVVLFAALIVSGVSGHAHASDEDIQNEVVDLTLYFLETRESGDNWVKYPVMKWDRPISYSIIGAYTSEEEAIIATHAAQLSDLTNIEITRRGPIAKPFLQDRLAENSALGFETRADYFFQMRVGSKRLNFDTVTTFGFGREAYVYLSNLTIFFADQKTLAQIIQTLGSNSLAVSMSQGLQPCAAVIFPPRKEPEALIPPQNIVVGFVLIRSDLEEWMLMEMCSPTLRM
jgi:hypothetical protein